MATGTFVASWHDGKNAHAFISVPETEIVDGVSVTHNVEYHVKTPLFDADNNPLPAATLKANLAAAASAMRSAVQSMPHTSIPLSGQVTV